MRMPVNPKIIVEKMNHGIFGIIDFGENYGKSVIRESETMHYGNSV